MYLRYLVLAFGSVIVAGCSIHPLPEDFARDTTFAIVKKIRCEARQAIDAQALERKFDTAAIAYQFRFTITENNDATGDAQFSLPFSHGTFTLAVGGGETKQRVGEREFTIVETFKELRQEDCSIRAINENIRYPITGVVGLDETVTTFVRLAKGDLLEPGGSKLDDGSFIDTLEFTTEVSGNVNPSVDLNPVKNKFRLAEAKANFSAKRSDKHRLVISLSIPTKARDGGAKKRAADNLRSYDMKFLRIDRLTPLR